MEGISKAIKRFLALDYGYGSGDGSGDGFGSGYGSGDGFGSGYGSGDGYDNGYGHGHGYGSGIGYGSGDGFGSGDGSGYGGWRDGFGSGIGYGDGYGDGFGDGIISFNGQKVHYIDEMPTVIEKVHGNLAKGFIINDDLTTQACVIIKGSNKFAHGSTAKEALKALQDKIFESMDTDEKITAFLQEFKSDVKYPAKSFYEWHHKLTGSCEFGRNAFVENHGIDIDNGMYTVQEFIDITKNDYGGEIIQQIEERLEE